MASISNLGVGSGLNLGALLDQLSTAEKIPLMMIQTGQASYQTKLSAYGRLQGMLAAFQTAAKQLGDPNYFKATTATSSNTAVLSAVGNTTAAPGTYSLNVTALAQTQSLIATGQTSQTAPIGTGTIHIDLGTITGGTFNAATGKYTGATFTPNAGSTGVNITIDSTNNSLQGVRDAINKANAGVTASIVNDGSGTPYRLVLTSTATGATNSMRISVTGAAPLSNLLNYDPAATQNLSQTVTAQNAQMTVNNIAVQSASNTVTGAVPGVTLTLAQTGTSTVTVQRDTKSMQAGVQAFVTAYNNLQNAATSLSAYDPSSRTGSPLTGDGVLRILQSQIRGALNAPQPGSGPNAITTLPQVGVTIQKDGTMQLDSTKLSSALSANPSGVAALFSNSDGKSGYGNQINNLVTTMMSANGSLTSATDGITRILKTLSDQYTATQKLVDARIANYRAQFTQLDTIMAKMKSTSSYLTQQFSALSK